MKRKSAFIILLCLVILWALAVSPLHAQKTPTSLTLLYSNNFNGEIEPCPT